MNGKIKYIVLVAVIISLLLVPNGFAKKAQEETSNKEEIHNIPKGFEVKSVTRASGNVFLHVLAVNSATGEALMLYYRPDQADPVAVIKFVQAE